ncbi:MAG: methionyl-tRNA formyltransferase [Clostridiales bacterium]|jgi:methionyl-tRNA formyltransferase|nr:methionyl-tRNA formyltransferase [Clostridiales bacterium]
MKIIFMGTPDFAVPPLAALIDNGFDIAAVVTQPDKPRGRGGNSSFSPVKRFAAERGIRVLQYEKIGAEGLGDLKGFAPDLMVTAAYGQILTREIIDIPKYGILNVHASLLPKYRGAAPIQQAVINGDAETGVTIMRTELQLDRGDILVQKRLQIAESDTAGDLFIKLAALGAEAVIEGVNALKNGTAVFLRQNDADAVYCKTIRKEDARISFEKTPVEIVNFIRGMNPFPTAFTKLDGETVKVFRAETIGDAGAAAHICGDIISADAKNGLIVAAKGGAVRLAEIQFPGGKRMSGADYLRGHGIKAARI